MIVTLKCTKGPHVNHIFVIKPKSVNDLGSS